MSDYTDDELLEAFYRVTGIELFIDDERTKRMRRHIRKAAIRKDRSSFDEALRCLVILSDEVEGDANGLFPPARCFTTEMWDKFLAAFDKERARS